MSTGLRATLRLPPRALRAVAGPEKRNDRGDVLDLQTQALLRLVELAPFPKAYEQTPVQARGSLQRETRLADPSPPTVARVSEHACEGPAGRLPLRVYRPRETGDRLPVLVYYHGGGFVLGSLDSHDGVCRRLARGADCIVVAVNYRLGPEHRFPAAIEDGAAAFEWIADNAADLGGDPARVAVGGDSAGGCLAAVLCHRQRDAAGPQPALQLLIYPVTDQSRSMESHGLFDHGYYLDKPLKDWFVDNYLHGPEQERDPRASPLFAERFDGLAPAVIASAGFDPLRDEDEAYAERLRGAGVAVTELYEPALVHGFLNMPGLREPGAAIGRIAAGLRARLHAAA